LIEQKLWPALRGGGMPVPLFDQVKRLRDEYRAKSLPKSLPKALPKARPRTRAKTR
jgi:hypothetical protein